MQKFFKMIALVTVAMLCCLVAKAQYPYVSCAKRPFTTRLVQVDQMDRSTVFYFEYSNDGDRYMNVYEDIVARDASGNIHRLLNSYNMPLSDEDHSHQLVLTPAQQHRFALEFEKMVLDKPFDIVESESNPRALNFYGVTVDTLHTAAKIPYDEWVMDYPVKEHGFYVQDGETVQFVSFKGVTVATRMQQTNEYGKYFTVDVDVQNNGDRDILLDPARITASSFLPKKHKEVAMKVLSADEYDKKVKRSQFWTNALVIAAGVAVTAAVAAVDASTDKGSDHRRHDSPAPPRHVGWRPARVSHHPYYPTDHYRSRYHSRDMGGLATAATAVTSAAVAAAVIEGQNDKRADLQAGYIRANTIARGAEYMGYFHIKHEKTDNLEVNIPIKGENFTFHYQWQDK